MLIRNSYGRSDLFVLPGGGIRLFEAPDQQRGVRRTKELGCDAETVELLGTYASNAEGKRDTIHLLPRRRVAKRVRINSRWSKPLSSTWIKSPIRSRPRRAGVSTSISVPARRTGIGERR